MIRAARILLAALCLVLVPCLAAAAAAPALPQQQLGGVVLGDLTFSAQTPDKAMWPDTGAAGWEQGPGTQSIDYLVAFDGFFAANSNAHFVVMGRAKLDAYTLASTNWRGQGMLFGNVIGAREAPDAAPVALIETWGKGLLPDNARYLFPASMSPRLLDTGYYRVSLQLTLSTAGLRYIRYTIHRMNDKVASFDLVMDTGDVQDNNWTPDLMTQQGLALAVVGASNQAFWQIRVMQLRVTWMPAYRNLPDLTALPWRRP